MAKNEMIQFFKQLSGKLGSNIYAGLQGTTTPQSMAFIRELQKEMKKSEYLTAPLEELNVIVFDIETTGFYPERGDEIISIGAVRMTGSVVHEDQMFYSLIKTDSYLPEQISLLTGIAPEDLSSAPTAKDVLLEFFKFIQSDILVAHHSKHEQSFMQKVSWDHLRTKFEHRIIDTSFLMRLKDPYIKSPPLENICEDCGIKVKNRHHALGDAVMTAHIWAHYLHLAQKEGFTNLQDVYEHIGKL